MARRGGGGGLCAPCTRCNYLWELWTGLYMLEASEKVAFNVFLACVVALALRFLVPALPLPALASLAALARGTLAALAAAAK